MSCDIDDDDIFDPIESVEKIIPIEIKIDCVSKQFLEEIESQAKKALEQKLTKLNLILKNLNVYCHNNTLLVNDRYGVCKDIGEIVSAFGMQIAPVECGLRGKSYIIQDGLVALISTINPTYKITDIANCNLTQELISVIENAAKPYSINNSLTEIFASIIQTGSYSVIGQQKVTIDYIGSEVISETFGEIVSDSKQVTSMLQKYMSDARATLSKANENLRDGTVKLLRNRAKQMGYAIEEKRQGTEVQLVLVRME